MQLTLFPRSLIVVIKCEGWEHRNASHRGFSLFATFLRCFLAGLLFAFSHELPRKPPLDYRRSSRSTFFRLLPTLLTACFTAFLDLPVFFASYPDIVFLPACHASAVLLSSTGCPLPFLRHGGASV